jgi:Ser/Thr protein kinase RdoA (MazF antagonist)
MPAVPPRVEPPGTPPPVTGPPTLVGHLDVTPENVVFRDGRAFALIDFDLARPATRGEEVANLLLWWAPLQPPEDRPTVVRDADVLARAALLVDAYGLEPADRDQVVRLQLRQAERSWHLMRWRAEHVGGGWRRMWREGVGDAIRRRQAWLEEHADRLSAVVTAAERERAADLWGSGGRISGAATGSSARPATAG